MLALLGVPASILSEVKASSCAYGNSVNLGRLPGGIPVASLIGDSHAVVGLGAPHWNEAARGLLSGVTRGTTAAQVARATIIAALPRQGDRFEPQMSEAERETLYAGWRQAVRRALLNDE